MKFEACKVADIPAIGNADNPIVKLLLDFLNSNIEAAEITGTTYSINSTAGTLRATITRNNLPVKVMQRRKRLFLVRTDLKKEAEARDADT